VSIPEAAHETEAQQIIALLEAANARMDKLTDALNTVGANSQWLVDNCKVIFEMFNSPMFSQMMPVMAGGAMGAMMGGSDDGQAEG